MAKSKKVQEVAEESDAGSEEEFEVQKVLKHKRKGSSLEYFVSWVGYKDEDNSWSNEGDMGGAEGAINAYWKTLSAEKRLDRYAPTSAAYKKAKAALSPAKKPASSRAAPSSSKSKRSAAAKDESDGDEEEEEEEEEEAVVKPNGKAAAKPKKAPAPKKAAAEPAPKKKRESKPEVPEPSPELEENGDVGVGDDDDPAVIEGRVNSKHEADYESRQDWEPLVEKIDTVERAADGVLKLLVVWQIDGSYSWVASGLVRARCPQKVIDFYEGHLKFSVKEDDEAMETDE